MLSAKPFFTLRSKRLYDRFVDAPDIHFVKIDPFRWSKLYEKKSLALDSVSQWNCFAIVPQNDCGSSIDFLYISWYCSKLLMYAFLLISSFGANSIVLSFEDILAEAKFFYSLFEIDDQFAGIQSQQTLFGQAPITITIEITIMMSFSWKTYWRPVLFVWYAYLCDSNFVNRLWIKHFHCSMNGLVSRNDYRNYRASFRWVTLYLFPFFVLKNIICSAAVWSQLVFGLLLFT